MARTQAQASLSPTQLAFGSDALADDVLAVSQQLNWSMGWVPQVLASGALGRAGWDGGNEPAIVMHPGIMPSAGSGFAVLLSFPIWIPLDTTSLTLGAEMYCGGADTATVRITVGAATPADIAFAAANNGTLVTATLSSGFSIEGWTQVVVSGRRDSGADAATELRFYYIAQDPYTSLPAPTNA